MAGGMGSGMGTAMNWLQKISQQKLLIIARGSSGSGKSRMTKEISEQYIVLPSFQAMISSWLTANINSTVTTWEMPISGIRDALKKLCKVMCRLLS